MTVHVYAPAPAERMVRWSTCPDCCKRSPFAVLLYEWHGADSTCMRCGRNFQDGQWCRLDLVRDARRKSKDAARAAWKRAKP